VADFRQSVAWWCLTQVGMTPEAIIEAAADTGYGGVEFAPPEHWQAVQDHGLALTAINGHASLTEGLNRRENHAAIEREILTNLDHAARRGIANLICFSGNRYDGVDDDTGAAITAEGLARVAGAAEDAGVTLVLELLNSKVNHPGYQCDHTAWGVRVCETVNSPRVRLLYDIYHMQIMEGDIIRTIQQHHAWFGHYHTAGNPGRHDLDDAQELQYPAIMRAVAATGYTGFIGQEFLPKGEPVAALRHAFALCNIPGTVTP